MNFRLCTILDRKLQTFPNSRVAGVAVLVALALPAFGQTLGLGTSQNAPPAPQPTETDPLGRTTPRGTATGFIRAADRDDYVAAARYMEVNDKQKAKAEELARELRELLNRYLHTPLATISDSPSGDLDDGLPLDRDRVPLRIEGQRVDLILVRVKDPQAGSIWLISSDTLARVPTLYKEIQKTWIEQVMPQSLLDKSFLGVSAALWVAWMASIALPLLLFWSISRLAMFLVQKTVGDSRRRRLEVLAWPLIVVLTITVHLLLLPYLGMSLGFRLVYQRACSVLLVIAVAWLLHRIFALSFQQARSLMERRHRSDTESLMLLGQRVLNVILILATMFAVLNIAGVDTKTALAGVGIGGVAVAFGAQKTVENLLGGIFLLTDKALAVGDTCCISSRVGTIEDITLRSVRLRTLEQSLLSIPAGALSQTNIENFASRRKILVQTNLQLSYGTTAEQLRSVLEGIQKLLVENPKIETASARIRLVNFGARALELELYAYVLTPDNMEFLAVREELFLHVAEVVEASGSGFARPSEFFYAAPTADRAWSVNPPQGIEQPERSTGPADRSKSVMKRAI
jgi:MscS family membrane protein